MPTKTPYLCLIIPVFDEKVVIDAALHRLRALTSLVDEIILVDGGSTDGTADAVREYSDITLLTSESGRAVQMQTGAQYALSSGKPTHLLFAHIDTQLAPSHIQSLPNTSPSAWGCFDVALDGKAFAFRVIERLINARSRITGISTGDQCLWLSVELFNAVKGFELIPLMEDIAITQQLKKLQRPLRFKPAVITSSRRWQQKGIVSTVWLMWCLRFDYWRGVSPEQLSARYYPR